MSNRWAFLFSMLLWTMVACHQARLTNPLSISRDQPSATNNIDESNWKLLDTLGAYPGTTLIREYVQNHFVSRQYATDLPLEKGPAAVSVFYDRKILAQKGWKVLDHHAAISCYVKGNQIFCITRSGSQDPGLIPGASLRKSAEPPVSAKFFFTIETGPRP
jgi:hypothetical protein